MMSLMTSSMTSLKSPPYNLGKRVGPPLFPENKDNVISSKLDECLQRDIAWSVAGMLRRNAAGEQFATIGSWTSFNKCVAEEETERCVQEYLLVTPEYPVWKEYLDFC